MLRLSLNVADDADKEEEKENHLPLSLQENISPRKEKESRDSPSEKKRLSTANKTNRGTSDHFFSPSTVQCISFYRFLEQASQQTTAPSKVKIL